MITSIIKCGMKLIIDSKTSPVQPRELEMDI